MIKSMFYSRSKVNNDSIVICLDIIMAIGCDCQVQGYKLMYNQMLI